MLRIEDITLAPGGVPLLQGATWHLRPGDRVGLVGRNGTGKSTLISVLAGQRTPEHGTVQIRSKLRIGTLPQQAVSGSESTVWDEARSGMLRLGALRERLDRAEADLAAQAPGAVERHAEAMEAFRLAGGFQMDQTIGEVLHGLGFGPDEWRRRCDTFSGGWQMRVALAKVLLSEPDLALLDEPTNHLDLSARSWLSRFLAQAPFTTVVVSHDRHLLDAVPTRILEIHSGKLRTYTGNFSAFLVERESRRSAEQATFDRQQEEVAKLERFVERFKAKATKAAQARSRQNKLDRMELVDAPDGEQRLPKLTLPEAPPSAQEALILRDVTLGWPDSAPVLTGVDFVLERGMRVAVIGPNGSGKSTLLHALAGRLAPQSGRRRVGDRVRIGLFSQDLAAELPAEQTALTQVSLAAPMLPVQRVRTILGSLGLSGQAALREIGHLSGGEKARVALASLVVKPANVLLLDEPTNHLDAETVEVLVRALQAYEGALFLVTHDRYLVESLATHVVRVNGGRIELSLGVRPEDLEPLPLVPDERITDDSAAVSHADRKRIRRERERAAKRVQAIHAEIEACEAAIARIDERLYDVGGDFGKAQSLGTERGGLEAKHEALFAEWEALEELLAQPDPP